VLALNGYSICIIKAQILTLFYHSSENAVTFHRMNIIRSLSC